MVEEDPSGYALVSMAREEVDDPIPKVDAERNSRTRRVCSHPPERSRQSRNVERRQSYICRRERPFDAEDHPIGEEVEVSRGELRILENSTRVPEVGKRETELADGC